MVGSHTPSWDLADVGQLQCRSSPGGRRARVLGGDWGELEGTLEPKKGQWLVY